MFQLSFINMTYGLTFSIIFLTPRGSNCNYNGVASKPTEIIAPKSLIPRNTYYL